MNITFNNTNKTYSIVINSLESFVCKELGDNSHFLDILSSHPGFFLSPADTRGLTKAQAQAYIKLDRWEVPREDPLTIDR